ncbi:hypothetical protein OS493_001946 [Desmophyllum pertusum]|uniref:Uncharacterized protein n=1 Tax=Desmophyllum pertusum TaxID=174260 RepID=A0A9W9Z795_9CNID|nr:hypothetical protein OS493_001946 [Desmophyllum pertusum]
MKTFTALLLLSALAAYVSASEMTFHRAVFDFLDERHDEKMAQVLRDQGFPEDTLVANDHPEPPKCLKPCIDNGKMCWKEAGHDACKKLACIDNFFKCSFEIHPPPLPKLTPLEKGCVALLYLCRNHSPTCAGELCCLFASRGASISVKTSESTGIRCIVTMATNSMISIIKIMCNQAPFFLYSIY